MSGISMGYARSRPFNGKNVLRRCGSSKDADNVVLIDIESNVIIIDAPEYLRKSIQRSSVQSQAKRRPHEDVICIDDDENSEDNHSGSGRENFDNFPNVPSSSKRPSQRFKHARKTPDENGDDCQFVRENKAPVKLSKCKRTYSGKSSSQNRFGLTSDSEDSASDSDIDLIVDSVGKLQEEWEKAFSKRKFDNTSRAEVRTEHVQTEEHPCSSNLGKASNKKEDASSGVKGNESSMSSSLRNEDAQNAKQFSSGKMDCLHEDPCSSGADDSNGQRIFPEHGSAGPCKTSFSRDLSPRVEINTEKCDNQENGQNDDFSIISEREKLKETDEYKKAQAEEMASRQRALQIQAEEAKELRKLLKRRKAEEMRLLDMEKRQKQRLDEIRETQKKDEENMNMKEVIRNQVRGELSKLEAICYDMASVLRGLGIHVGGSSNPQLNEVRVAYKKALLTFHPDRASRDNIRQLVEAEEKFKLISRMKEKYLPTL